MLLWSLRTDTYGDSPDYSHLETTPRAKLQKLRFWGKGAARIHRVRPRSLSLGNFTLIQSNGSDGGSKLNWHFKSQQGSNAALHSYIYISKPYEAVINVYEQLVSTRIPFPKLNKKRHQLRNPRGHAVQFHSIAD